jgi:hypothetical protein
MARNSAKKELRSFESTARNQRLIEGLHFGGVGAASVWTYPIVLATMFAINAFTTGLPEFEANNAAIGGDNVTAASLFYGSMVIGGVLAIIGIFRVKGRFWSIPGAAITWFLNPYNTMIYLLPVVDKIPGFFHHIGTQLFGG